MPTFEFRIIASGVDPDSDDFEARFHAAGCDDATISVQASRIILDFARAAETMDAAVTSAIDAIRAAGATVEGIELA